MTLLASLGRQGPAEESWPGPREGSVGPLLLPEPAAASAQPVGVPSGLALSQAAPSHLGGGSQELPCR